MTDKRVSPFIGGGVSYSNSSSEYFPPVRWSKSYTGLVPRTTTEINGIGMLAVFGLVGVEVFISKEVSLSAEYHLAYSRSSAGDREEITKLIQGEDPDYPQTEKTNGKTYGSFGFTTAGFITLAIYL